MRIYGSTETTGILVMNIILLQKKGGHMTGLIFVRSLQSRVGLYFPTVTIITIAPTQILQLRTLAKALLVLFFFLNLFI